MIGGGTYGSAALGGLPALLMRPPSGASALPRLVLLTRAPGALALASIPQDPLALETRVINSVV
jgi:hypothetical protein